jgi:predicted nucleic acid-binding protein
MGRLRVPKPLLYVDANVFMYAIEGDDTLAESARTLFGALSKNRGLAATSELTLAEVLPKARPDQQSSYFNLIIWSGIFDLRPISRDILLESARYRRAAFSAARGASGMPKLPDAIHIVTAASAGCRRLISNDHGWQMPVGITVVTPNPAGIAALLKEIS